MDDEDPKQEARSPVPGGKGASERRTSHSQRPGLLSLPGPRPRGASMSRGAGSDQARCSTATVPRVTPPGKGRKHSDRVVRQEADSRALGRGRRGPKARVARTRVQPGTEAPREARPVRVTLDLLRCSQQARPRVDSRSRDGPRGLTAHLSSLGGRCSGLTSCVPCPSPARGRFPMTPAVPPGRGSPGHEPGTRDAQSYGPVFLFSPFK